MAGHCGGGVGRTGRRAKEGGKDGQSRTGTTLRTAMEKWHIEDKVLLEILQEGFHT